MNTDTSFTILFVDDDASINRLAHDIFIESDADFVICNTVNGALTALDVHKMGVVVLDLCLDQGSGLQVLEYMEKNHIDVPVIVASGWIEDYQEELEKFDSLQLSFLKKPYSASELMYEIEKFGVKFTTLV